MAWFCYFFFFQAEDGIRDLTVTGVQTCALPISGVPRERILVDPGIGFGKTANQNWEVMRRLEELRELGQPVLIGTSRKSFVGKLLDLPVSARLEGTAATVTAAILRGADVVRVHDVAEMMRVVRVADRMR